MTRKVPLIVLFALFFALNASPLFAKKNSHPIRLAVILVFDQFRSDYLTRFESNFLPPTLPNGKVGGFRYLEERGANFVDCRYDHYPLYTAPGHAVISTGGDPYKTGIVSNEWYDSSASRMITSIEDDQYGKSPRHLTSTTIGDELKLSTDGKSKVVALSLKDRAAIMLGGFTANEVFWFDSSQWTTSPFYGTIPLWVSQLNQSVRDKGKLLTSPVGNELTFQMAESAILHEKLGTQTGPDFLAVNFASNDYVGHKYGPYSEEVKAITLESDRGLSHFLNFLNEHVPGGLNSILLVVTADHGVAPLPEYLQERKIPAERIDSDDLVESLDDDLIAHFGGNSWITAFSPPFLYLNHAQIAASHVSEKSVDQEVVECLRKSSWVQAAYSGYEVLEGKVSNNAIGKAILNSFVSERSGDVVIVPRINVSWMEKKGSKQAIHETPYAYDTHVPLLVLGSSIHPGTYLDSISPKDIAPTFAYLLKTQFPAACEGKILKEILR